MQRRWVSTMLTSLGLLVLGMLLMSSTSSRASGSSPAAGASAPVAPRSCPLPVFTPPTNYPVGFSPNAVAVADFNGDGTLDLVTANANANTVSVLLGDGAGGFGPATSFTVGTYPRAVAVGDFNGDGTLDLVTANANANTVSVLLGDGAGGFGPATSFAVSSLPVAVAVGDFNRDGSPDLVAANYGLGNVSVLLNNCGPPPPSSTPTVGSTVTNTSTLAPTQTPSGATATPMPNTPTSQPSNTPALTNTHTMTPARSSTPPATITAGPPTVTTCPLTFADVPSNNTFYANIRCLACRGIISGYADGTFRPGNDVTRGQLSKIVSNAAGYAEPPGAQLFEDVAPGSTFYDFVQRLASRGFINGYPCGSVGEPCGTGNLPYFRPNNNATRGQISKIVSNAAGFSEPAGAQLFEDVAPGSTFYSFVQRLASRTIINGYPCGSVGEPCGTGNLPYFRPNNNATRGQTSKIVANTFFPNCQTPSR